MLEHAERCRAERDRLAGAEEATGRLEQRARRGERGAARGRGKLHAARAKARRASWRSASCRELGELALADATFEVVISEREMTADRAATRWSS